MRHFLILPLTFLSCFLSAQNHGFQQSVSYNIKVNLDYEKNELNGEWQMTYQNNSDQSLSEIHVNLWANAFSNKSSDYSKQMLTLDNTEFYFASEDDMGGFSNLDFKANDRAITTKNLGDSQEMIVLTLSKDLRPGDSIIISSPFKLKVPMAFSHLGRMGKDFYLTHWYPCVAVFDQDGWHSSNYLQLGGEYSDFADYDVDITVPINFIVSASGQLNTDSERIFRESKKLSESSNITNSSSKTINFTAQKIPHFSWFASSDFTLNSKKVKWNDLEIEVLSFYHPQNESVWLEALKYMEEAIIYFSDQIGAFPFSKMSVVQGPHSSSSSYEFPMLSIINNRNDKVNLKNRIYHEIAHQWFYASVGNNKRANAWIDEGLARFYQFKLLQTNTDFDANSTFIVENIDNEILEFHSSHYYYLWQKRRGQYDLEPLEYNVNRINYYLNTYDKPAMAWAHLEAYIGSDKFNQVMANYYDEFRQKHSDPEKLKSYFEEALSMDLSWMFDDIIGSSKNLDYSIKKVKRVDEDYKIKVTNKGAIKAPIELVFYKEEKILHSVWLDGFEGEKEFTINCDKADFISIDGNNRTLDVNRKNNHYRTNALFKKAGKVELGLYKPIERSTSNRISLMPSLNYNVYDGFMPALTMFSPVFPSPKWQFAIVPGYGLKSKQISGIAHINYDHINNNSSLDRIRIGADARRFSYRKNEELDFNLSYYKINPYIELNFLSKTKSKSKLRYDLLFINEEFTNFINPEEFEIVSDNNMIHQLSFETAGKNKLHPSRLNAWLEYSSYNSLDGENQNYLKLETEANSDITYAKNKRFNIRLFAAYFLVNSQRETVPTSPRIARGSIAVLNEGYADYRYNDYFFARNEQEGIFSNQINPNEGGGFKTAVTSRYNFGRSNDYAIAMNLSMDLPFGVPRGIRILPFADFAYYGYKGASADPLEGRFIYSAGVMLKMLDDAISIHFPFINSDIIESAYNDKTGTFKRVSFFVDLNKLSPYRWLDNL